MEDEYEILGYIAISMDEYRYDNYQRKEVRKPPRVYKTEGVANRYGKAVPVYIKKEKENGK